MQTMAKTIHTLWLAVGLLLLASAAAQAAQLTAIELVDAPYYVEVRLTFDTRPTYDDSFRYDPDRYLLTFYDCTVSVPPEKLEALGELDNHLLTKISTYQGAENLALGCYLTQRFAPLVRHDDTHYYLRFYTAVRLEKNVQLGTGVSLVEKLSSYKGQNFHLYLIKADPGAQVKLFAAAADRYDGRTRLRTPVDFAAKEQALVVANGGFFGPNGEHLSTLIEDGFVRATGVYPTRPLLIITPAGQVVIGRFNVESYLEYGGKRVTVSAKNYPLESGTVIAYDHLYPLSKLPQNAVFYYILENGRLSYHDTNTAGLDLKDGQILIATDIIPEANPLQDIPAGSAVGFETVITDATGTRVDAASAIGGAPMLVEHGRMSITVAEDNVRADIAKSERSRTAVGLTASGQLLIAVVREAEGAGYGGVTLEALAGLLLDEGAVTAMNLDGGGSSALVVAGDVLNLSAAQQRKVSNVLVLKLGGGGLNPAAAGYTVIDTKYTRQEDAENSAAN